MPAPPTATAPTSSPGSSPTGASVTQGPDWLISQYSSPPPWLNPALQALALLTVVVVAYRLYQWDGDIPLDVQREMQIIVAYITAIVTATLAMVYLADVSYLVDVVAGFAAGYGAVLALQAGPVASRLPGPTDPRERVTAAWLCLGVFVVVGPMVVATRGIGVQLTTSRWLLAGIATVFVAYNTTILSNATAAST